MNRSLAILSFSLGISSIVHAQTAADTSMPKNIPGTGSEYQANGPQKGTPTKRAAHQLNVLQEKLNLNQDQVIQLNMILLNRETSLDSLKTNQSGDKKSDMRAHRNIARGADQQINALLTDDQKKLYQQWKETMKEERIEKRKAGAGAGAAAPPAAAQ